MSKLILSKPVVVVITSIVVFSGFIIPVGATLGSDRAVQQTGSTYLEGSVKTQSGQNIASAQISILTKNGPRTVETNGIGEFLINLQDYSTPDPVLLIADADGYAGTSALVNPGNRDIDIRLQQAGIQLIDVEQEPTQIGDGLDAGDFDADRNIALDEEADERELETTFEIGPAQSSPEFVTFFISVQGSERENSVYLNGQQIGVIKPGPPKGRSGTQEILIDESLLREGENTLYITSSESERYNSYSERDGYDDFVVHSVQLRLEGIPVDESTPQLSMSGPETVPVGEEARFTAQVRDNSIVDRTMMTLWRGDTLVTQRVSTGESIEISRQMDSTGNYRLLVWSIDQSGNLATAETAVSVIEETATETATSTPTTTSTSAATPSPTTSSQGPGLGIGITVVTLLVTTLFLIRRRFYVS